MRRASSSRFLRPAEEDKEEMEVRDLIQKIAVGMPAYGYRRITAELGRPPHERIVNHKDRSNTHNTLK